MAGRKKQSTEAAVREIRRRTRRKFAPEEKIRIVLEGLQGEQSIAELCRREGIAANLYYRWSKDFLEAGKRQLAGDTVREATSDEVKELRAENSELKEVVAEITLEQAHAIVWTAQSPSTAAHPGWRWGPPDLSGVADPIACSSAFFAAGLRDRLECSISDEHTRLAVRAPPPTQLKRTSNAACCALGTGTPR